MLFKKSTKAIVTGKRKEEAPQDGEQLSMGAGFENEQPGPQAPKNLLKWLLWGGCGLAALIVVVVLAALLGRAEPAPGPTAENNRSIISVTADTALADLVSAGDVVQLFSSAGTDIPELRYVEVYGSAAEGGLLLLVDDKQAAALVSQQINPKVALIVHEDFAQAETLLDLQRRINDPQITMTLQSQSALVPGETVALNVEVSILPEEAILPEIQWSSSNPEVVVVEDGSITAVGVGKATIFAECGDQTAACMVTVSIPLQAITLDHTNAMLGVGETLQLSAVSSPAEATDFAVTWSSSNEAAATVTQDGIVTGADPGTTTITASCNDITASCEVTVGYHAEVVQLDKPTVSMETGSTVKLTATVYPGDRLIDKGSWSSSDTALATVAEDGSITAIAPGTVTITYKCGDASASCQVTITGEPIIPPTDGAA